MNSKVGKYIETDFIHICEGEICFPYVALKLKQVYTVKHIIIIIIITQISLYTEWKYISMQVHIFYRVPNFSEIIRTFDCEIYGSSHCYKAWVHRIANLSGHPLPNSVYLSIFFPSVYNI